jgi:hypothetical protein
MGGRQFIVVVSSKGPVGGRMRGSEMGGGRRKLLKVQSCHITMSMYKEKKKDEELFHYILAQN